MAAKPNIISPQYIFTDRVEPRKVFQDAYNKLLDNYSDSDITVIHFYGIGGIGKTWLMQYLANDLRTKNQKNMFIEFSFGNGQDNNDILSILRNLMINKYPNFEFPLFDFAYYNFLIKNGADSNSIQLKSLLNNSSPLKKAINHIGNAELVSDLAFSITNESMLNASAKDVFALLTGIPHVGSLVKLADNIWSYQKTKQIKNSSELENLLSLDATGIFKLLPYYFSLDFENNIKNQKKPFTIFLDSYEFFQYQDSHNVSKYGIEAVLSGKNGLVRCMSNVLWVLSGRDVLKWNKKYFTADQVDMHLIGNLSKEDTYEYLENIGIYETDFYEAIYKQTEGLPLFLYSFYEYYKECKEGDIPIEIDDIQYLDMDELLERYLEILKDDNSKEILYILSCLPFWGDESIESIFKKGFDKDLNVLTYNSIKSMSFINSSNSTISDDRAYYSINPMIQKVFLKNCPIEIKNKFKRYLDQIKENNLDKVKSIGNEMFKKFDYMYLDINLYDFEWYICSVLLRSVHEGKLKEFYNDELKYIEDILFGLYLKNGVNFDVSELIDSFAYRILRDSSDSNEIPEIFISLSMEMSHIYYYLEQVTIESDRQKLKEILYKQKHDLALKALAFLRKPKKMNAYKRIELLIRVADQLSTYEFHDKVYNIKKYALNFYEDKNYFKLEVMGYTKLSIDLMWLSYEMKKYSEVEVYIKKVFESIVYAYTMVEDDAYRSQFIYYPDTKENFINLEYSRLINLINYDEIFDTVKNLRKMGEIKYNDDMINLLGKLIIVFDEMGPKILKASEAFSEIDSQSLSKIKSIIFDLVEIKRLLVRGD